MKDSKITLKDNSKPTNKKEKVKKNKSDIKKDKKSEVKSKKDKKDKNHKNKQKIQEGLDDVSIIKDNEENKGNLLEYSFVDDELTELTKEIKDITKKAINTDNKLKEEEAKQIKEEIKKETDEQNFIPLKDDPRFKDETKVYEIEKQLEFIKDYEVKGNIANKMKFKEIEHDDVITFNDESILQFFKSLNFILSDNSKQKLNLLYFCIKHGITKNG